MAKLPIFIVRLNLYSFIASEPLCPCNDLFDIRQYLFSLEGFKRNNLSVACGVV